MLQGFMIFIAKQTTSTTQNRDSRTDIGSGYRPPQATQQYIKHIIHHKSGKPNRHVLIDLDRVLSVIKAVTILSVTILSSHKSYHYILPLYYHPISLIITYYRLSIPSPKYSDHSQFKNEKKTIFNNVNVE